MSKPRIALYANVYDTTVGQKISYMTFFHEFGDVVLVSSENDLEHIIKTCDVLALPGGLDVNSLLYGSSPGFNASSANAHYEYLDENLLKPWLKTGKPIVGICRGIQALNVAMGGSLHRDVDGHVQDESRYPRSYTGHIMYTAIPNRERIPINSFHHQAINKLAPGFQVIGWCDLFMGCPSLKKNKYFNFGYWKKKDSSKIFKNDEESHMIPELIVHESKPYIAFQYHPEDLMDDFSLSLVHGVLDNYFKNAKYATEINSGNATTSNQSGKETSPKK